MGENKIVIAILVAGLCISAAIYFGGQKSEKQASVAIPAVTDMQQEAVVSPVPEQPLVVASSTAELDDLTPIAVAIGKEFGTNPDNYIVTKSRQVGAYAIGGVVGKGEQTGGAQWWGVQENGVWKYIYSGQSYPNCSIVAPYQIPKELLDTCADDATNELKPL